MIDAIELKNFKCFSELHVDLGKLNVFSGLNGMGKSTVLQCLLMFKQSQEQENNLRRFILNGKYVSLGTGRDVLYENTSDEIISIVFKENDATTEVVLDYDPDSDVLQTVRPVEQRCEALDAEFEYLNAERLAPKTTYEKSSLYVNQNQLGINGQYTAHYLSIHQDDEISGMDGYPYSTLREGIQHWLNEISPNVKLNVTQIANADLAQINYYYTGLKDSMKTREYRPTNVGFGISYILPIITALLKAQSGSILIIENPEAHLHPRGQRKMGELIALCSSRGVQVLVETHSDHVVNGIRISVKNQMIGSEDVKVFFFNNHNGTSSHDVETPKILSNGRFDFWPDGFFDEWEKALDEIV